MREQPIRLSLLDFSWVRSGQSPAQSLRDTIAVGKRADALGFARFWLGEHHLEGHACGSPQVLAGILASATRRIRVGIGAMLLHYWSPLKLAEDFRLLQAVFGRIDLGLGRGRADNHRSHLALLDGRPQTDEMLDEDTYRTKIDDVLAFMRDAVPEDHPHHGAAVIPELAVCPEVWICGSGTAGPEAARTGSGYCCTLFHGRMVPSERIAHYREAFRPSAELATPRPAIAICGVCAETEAEAIAIRERFPYRNYLPTVIGDPQQCRARIDGLRHEYDVDEVVFLDIAPDGASRLKSLELLAQVFELGAR